MCHAVRRGDAAKVGFNRFGFDGRGAGSADGLSYARAMRDSGIDWNDETLDAFILIPQKFIPGNRMGYAGQSNAEQRADIIAYLKSLQPEAD